MTAHDALVDGLVERLGRPGGTGIATVVVGAPGSGRTTLLRATAERWPGVVWTTAGRSTRTEPALASSLRRWESVAETLPSAQRDTLRRARSMDPDDGDGATVSLVEAIVALVTTAATAHPVLWCVDDLDRTDPATRRTIEQVGRAAGEVRLLGAARSAPGDWSPVQVPPLGADLETTLGERHDLAPPVARSVARHAAGNPGAAHALAAELTRHQRDGTDDLPDPWPVDDALLERSRALVDDLGGGRADAVARAVAHARVHHRGRATTGETVRDTGLIDPDGRATPPWIVDALVVTLPRPALLAAHLALAARTDGDESLCHRALAEDGVDADLTDDLLSAARRQTSAARLAEATTLLERAHAVAPTARRAAIAREIASIALLRGRPGTAQRWSAVAAHDNHHPDPLDHTAIYAASSVETDAATRRHQLREVVAAAAAAPPARRAPLLVQLVVWGQTFALPGVLDDVVLAESLLPDVEPRDGAVIAMTAAIARRLVAVDPGARDLLASLTPRVHERLAAAPTTLDVSDASAAPSVAAQWLGVVAMSDERWDDAESLLAGAERLESARGWTVMRASTVTWLSELRWRQGQWDEAVELARHAEVNHAGTTAARAVRDAVLARDAALRALEPPVVDGPSGDGGIGDLLHHHGLALGALGAGRPDLAVRHLRRAERLGGGTLDHGGLIWWRADLVEALAATADLDAADEVLADLERLSVGSPLGRAQLLRARAARQQGRAAIRLLGAAVTALLECPVPFEVARTRLALAEALRHAQEPDAEVTATAARDVFVDLGAAGWARRAERVLDDARPAAAWSALTDRGREITREVARGRTNRQIASALGLSEKTVEFHLGRVYRTLDVSGRAELAARFATTPGDTGPDD